MESASTLSANPRPGRA